MKQRELMREVESVIDERQANNEPASMSWIVHAVMKRHKKIEGVDKDFFLLCGAEHVHDTVRDVLRSRVADESKPEHDTADLFPGFTRLQRSYTTPQGDEHVVIKLEQMTYSDCASKERELRTIGVGAIAHADEMRTYMAMRWGSATA